MVTLVPMPTCSTSSGGASFPSAVTWQAGRAVYLSLLSASKVLPRDELLRRSDRLATIFSTRDRGAALAAIAASGAQWVYAPASLPLRFQGRPGLVEALAEAIAGAVGQAYAPLALTVRVRKPHPPVAASFDGIEVEITRRHE